MFSDAKALCGTLDLGQVSSKAHRIRVGGMQGFTSTSCLDDSGPCEITTINDLRSRHSQTKASSYHFHFEDTMLVFGVNSASRMRLRVNEGGNHRQTSGHLWT